MSYILSKIPVEFFILINFFCFSLIYLFKFYISNKNVESLLVFFYDTYMERENIKCHATNKYSILE